jgi:uncharacterized protein YkvS
MEKQKVVRYLMNIDTVEEIRELWDVLRNRMDSLQRNAAYSFNVGDLVEFNSRRTGSKVVGVVKKVNRKTILVKSQDVIWKVTSSLLKKCEKV